MVPKEGATISGQRFEAGTVVGMSIWVAHRHVETFGEDCNAWRPERWLCEESKRRRMENAMLTVRTSFPYIIPPCVSLLFLLIPASQFGAGHRVCLGKNISYLELYKLVPTLLRIYEVSFHHSLFIIFTSGAKHFNRRSSSSLIQDAVSGKLRIVGLLCRRA